METTLPETAERQARISLWGSGSLRHVLMALLISCVILGLASVAVWQERQLHQARASIATQNIARLLERDISDDFARIDVGLQAVALHYQEETSRQRIDAGRFDYFLARHLTLQPEVLSLRVLDPQGFVKHGGNPQTTSVSLADRDFFMRARDDPGAGLIFSGPEFSSFAQQWVIVLARRLEQPDGSFAGVVYANIATSTFESELSSVALGPNDAIALRTSELALVHRFPDTQGAVGNREVSAQLRAALAASPENGDYIATNPIDDIERSNAYRKLQRYPFYVIVGQATQDYLNDLQEDLQLLGGVAALAILVTCAAALLVYRSTQQLSGDIARRKAVEARLAASMREVEDLYNNAPCGYYSVDANGNFLRVNDTVLKWIGHTREELIGKRRPTDFYSVISSRQSQLKFPGLMDSGFVEGAEFELLDRDGNIRHVGVTANAVFDEAGNFVMSRSVMYDISAQRQAQEEAYRLAQEQAAMFDNTLIGIVKLRARNIVWHNKAMQRIYGYAADELTGQSSRIFYPDEASYQGLGNAAYPVLRSGKPFRQQIVQVRKDGNELWIDATGVMLSSGTGESMWMMADITPLKQAEDARFRAAQLEAENHKLVEAAQLKDRFIATMSHELRTPLNAVIGLSALMLRGQLGPESPKYDLYLRNIADSGRHLLTLIEEVLDLAKVASGKLDFHPEPLQLPALLASVINLQLSAIEAKHIAITCDVAPNLDDIVLDRLRLKQVVTNLLSNAIKFTPENGKVAIRALAQDDKHLRIEVEDNGIGIAPQDLPRLFRDFEQLQSGLTRQHGGTGLGLALSRRLVEAQGGSVGVHSTLGVGSCFHIVLPRVFKAESRDHSPSPAPQEE
jgi:PAS domain S-box-containing protein